MTDASTPTRGRIGRGLGIVTVGNLLLRVGNLGVTVIVTYLLLPEQFGVFAVALTVWSVLQTVAEFGLGSDLVRASDPIRRVPTVTTVSLLISGGLCAAMVVTAPLIADAFDSPASAPIISVMAVAMALFGLTTVPAALLMREFRQGAVFVVNLSALVTSTAVMTLMALAGQGPMSLAVGQIVAQLVTVVGLHVAARHVPRFGFDAKIARESTGFSLPLAAANLVSWVLITVDNLIVSKIMGPEQLAFYVLAFNISSWPMSAIGQAIRVIALPAFARVPTDEARAATYERVVGLAWTLSLALGAGLALLAVPLLDVVFKPIWAPAAYALFGLGLFGAFRVVFDLTATFLVAAGRSRTVLVVQLVWLAALLPVMVLGVRWFGLAGAGWAHVLVVALVIPAYLVAVRRAGVSPAAVLRGCLRPTLVALPTMITIWLIAHTDLPSIAMLALGAVAAGLFYVAPLRRWWLARVRALSTADETVSTPELAAPTPT